MAWTLSAPRGDAFAITVTALAGPSRLVNHLTAIGYFGADGRPLAAFAVVVTLTCASAVHLNSSVIAVLLMLNAIALAISARRERTARLPSTDAMVPRPERTALFPELIAKPEKHALCDASRWATLTTHMSHELRTPLNAVIGFSELMTQQAFGPLGSSCYDTYARGIHASGIQLLKSAEDALAITAILTAGEKPHAERIADLAVSVDDALNFCTAGLNEHALIPNLRLSSDLLIMADAQSVRQMLINIVTGAQTRASTQSSLDFAAARHGDEIELAVSVTHPKTTKTGQANDFALTLAATLAELSGAKLSSHTGPDGAWQTRVRFLSAAQRDFFA